MSQAEQPPSRLSKTNRADHENPRLRRQRRRSLKEPLTERDGVRLREEVRAWGDVDGDRPTTWGGTLRAWREYIEETGSTRPVFENGYGDRVVGRARPHRFDPEYSDKQYAKLKDLERGISRAYGRRLHTAMLTLTCSSTRPGSSLPRPPVDHLDELNESWEAVRRALSRVLDGRRWEYLAILEPHKSGYLHIHVAVFVEGVVTASTFAPVIEAHVRNCEGAGWEAHDVDDDSTISVRHAGRDRDGGGDGLDELAIYLAEYLGCYGDDPLDAPEQQQMANAVLWATGRQRWRPSQGAQQYMKTNAGESLGDWELVAVETEEGEIRPAVPGAGVETFVTSTDPPPEGES